MKPVYMGARISGAQGIPTILIKCNNNEQGLKYLLDNNLEWMPIDLNDVANMWTFKTMQGIDLTGGN